MSMVKPSPLRSVEENTLSPDSELIQAAKAIRDEVLSIADKKFDSKIDSRIKSLESNVIVNVTKSLEGIKDQHAKDLETDLSVRLTKSISHAFRTQFAGLDFTIKSLELKLEESEKRAANLESIFEKSLMAMAQAFETGQKQLIESIKSLPVPHVHLSVPVDAIQVQQMPSIVNVPEGAIQIHQAIPQITIPKDSIMVEVNQKPSIVNMTPPVVNIPKNAINVNVRQEPSVVNIKQDAAVVNIPEKAIQVNVESKSILERVKGTTSTVKNILYDAGTGRPAQIVETTTEE